MVSSTSKVYMYQNDALELVERGVTCHQNGDNGVSQAYIKKISVNLFVSLHPPPLRLVAFLVW